MAVVLVGYSDFAGYSGPCFVDPLPASGSTGPCSGPSTLINVVGKRNLNGLPV